MSTTIALRRIAIPTTKKIIQTKSHQLTLTSTRSLHSRPNPLRNPIRPKSTAAIPRKPSPVSTSTSSSTTSSTNNVPLVQTTLAMAAGIATVGLTAYSVEQATASSCPPYSPTSQRFDQSTFAGRFSRMLLACDPRLVFYSDDDVRRAQNMILNHAALVADPPEGVANIHRSLWEAHRIASSALHPDTDEVIPRPFRMSGYVPYNGPVCVAMVASSSTPALLFWGWANQSQNALVNYFNRNAASEMSNETMIKSYAAAVGSALVVVFGLASLIKKRVADPEKARNLLRFVAFPSSMVASSLNCYIVRSPEMGTGIPLLDEEGREVGGGTSREAAKWGVYSTTASRALLQAPVFFLPPFLMSTLPFLKRAVARNPAMAVPMTTYLLLVSFGIGLPASVAIFPQISEISADDVEENFRDLTNERGERYKTFYYNKGL